MYTQSNRSDGIDTFNFATLYPVVGVDNCDLDSVAENRRLPLPRLHLPLEIGEPVFRDLADGCLRARSRERPSYPSKFDIARDDISSPEA